MTDEKYNNVDTRKPAIRSEYLPSTDFREAIPAWDEPEINLRDYLDVIIRRKWIIITVLAFIFISTVIFTLSSTKIFKASTLIEIKQAASKVTKFEELAPNQLSLREFYETQIKLLQSMAIARRIIDSMDLSNNPTVIEILYGDKAGGRVISGVINSIKAFIKLPVTLLSTKDDEKTDLKKMGLITEELLKEQALLGFVNSNLEVSLKRNSMLIDMSFTSPSRKLCMNVVNTAAKEYINWEMDKRLETSRSARAFLMKQIDQAKIDLEKSEEKLNQFAKQTGIVSLDTKLNSVYSQLEELNSALGEAQVELLAKEAVYRQAIEDGPSHLPQVMSSTVIGNLKADYSRLLAEYEDLTVTFHDDYPQVKALKVRMLSIGEHIKREEKKIFLSIANEYKAAFKKVKSLQTSVENQKLLALDLNDRATQYMIMKREVDTNKAIYQSLLERVKEIESMVGVDSSNIYIVDRASLPILPYKPKVLLNLMLAIVVGLFSGIGLAFLMEHFEDTITDPDQIADRFQIPILGLIPFSKNEGYSVEETFISDPKSAISEALRTIRVSIQLSGADKHAKSFLVTSTSPQEGKTTVAINLAMTFAGANEKVILIDCDLRKPRIHKILSLTNGGSSKGLSNFLAGVINQEYIHKTQNSNLYVIPSGPIPPNPVELLASNRFKDLIGKLENHFDRIILDSPPFHGLADILVLSRQVGGVILVSSIGETSRDGLQHFKREILNVQGTILGCVVNKIKLTKRYGYRSYYKYYKSYYSDYGVDKKGKRKKRGKRERTVDSGQGTDDTPVEHPGRVPQ